MATGIDVRHQRSCRSREGGRCNCAPAYQAHVFDKASGKRLRKTFPSAAAAKAWRQDALVAVRAGRLKASKGPTVSEAAEAWLAGARAGQVRNRSGDEYKPSAIRSYEQNLRIRVEPVFGARRLGEVQRVELQRFVDDLVANGMSPATVMTTLLPLRAIYRRALARGEVQENPTRGLEMPAIRRSIRYVASPEGAQRLLAVLTGPVRVLWATAFYAGLRRGELTALRWEDVDLASGVIHVKRGWDNLEGEIAPKSREGRRKVPIPAPLRDALLEHRMASNTHVTGRVFRSASWVRSAMDSARKDWKAANDKAAEEAAEEGREVEPGELLDATITLHEARHTYASFMIAAGVNAKALAVFMGHANIAITYDLYGHLFPGSEAEAAGLLEQFLARGRAAGAGEVPETTVANPVAQPTELALASQGAP